MNIDQYRNYWASRSALVRWSGQPRSTFSQENNFALFSLGFPRESMFEFTMNDPVQVIADGIDCFVLFNESARISIMDGRAIACMDEDMTGMYVNRSVNDFLFFITIMHGTLQGVKESNHDTAVLDSVERLRELDPSAFDRENSFWPLYNASYGF